MVLNNLMKQYDFSIEDVMRRVREDMADILKMLNTGSLSQPFNFEY